MASRQFIEFIEQKLIKHGVDKLVPKRDIIVKLPSHLQPRKFSPPPPPPKELGEYHLPAWDCLEEAEHGYVESQEAFAGTPYARIARRCVKLV